jgi:two-component system sensor histidine kinase UhpB
MSQLTGTSPEYAQRIMEQSTRVQESMQDIVWSINPMNDSIERLTTKMKEFAGEILEPKNISVEFEEAETLHGNYLNTEKRKNVFLVFKEAIINTAKYSHATFVKISLSLKHKTLQISITDNGRGFDATLVSKGNGLRNMKARAEAIGGRLFIRSHKDQGTSVTMEMEIT